MNTSLRAGMIMRAAGELGLRPLAYLALYRFGLLTGHYRRTLNARLAVRLAMGVEQAAFAPLWEYPSTTDLKAILSGTTEANLLAAADRIAAGRVLLFGAIEAPLQLAPPEPRLEWTAYENGYLPGASSSESDIKFLWEPARFGWVFTLGRAYLLSGNEHYPQTFWERFEQFSEANPAYRGPHWASAQETALRLIALTFALQIFEASPHSLHERKMLLLRSIAVHAGRIPPTLPYALAQNNNHLLSEAAALITAGLLLPHHPQANHWRRSGWRWFNHGLQMQIEADGTYTQHSTNYHRLMLQLGLWINCLSDRFGGGLEPASAERLAAATHWLFKLVDPVSGGVPNLGANDSAQLFPAAACAITDYRPTLQAAGVTFLGNQLLPHGEWDETSLWLGSKPNRPSKASDTSTPSSGLDTPHVLHHPQLDSWAYLRAASFNGRPGHADQLHLDLWWRGLNIAQDAGTYLYNAASPWDNALAQAEVHNTVTVDGQDQMTRAGRFLYLDQAQAEIQQYNQSEDGSWKELVARHDGYQRQGAWHSRSVNCGINGGCWKIIDQVYPSESTVSERDYTAVLHWLLPDWAWQIEVDHDLRNIDLNLESPFGSILLHLGADPAGGGLHTHQIQLARGGELIYGSGPVSPIWGWASPTYGVKVPALSVRYLIRGRLSIYFTSKFSFPRG